MGDAEFEELREASSLGAPRVKAAREEFSVYRPPALSDDVPERCPRCESADYGPVGLQVSYVVGVCRACGYTTDSNE